MAKATFTISVEVEIEDAQADLIKVAGREIISGINTSLDQNQNVEDIVVTGITANVSLDVDCMPDEELSELAQ